MRTTTRALVTFAATALIYGASPLVAQASRSGWAPDSSAARASALQSQVPPPQDTHTASETKVARGQLMRVDTDARTISIQSEQGAPMVFRYTETTRVVGEERGVPGLATKTGDQVTVRYAQQDKDNVASEIEIGKKG
jgi:hypothetical protein